MIGKKWLSNFFNMRSLFIAVFIFLTYCLHGQRLVIVEEPPGANVPKNYFENCVRSLNYDALFAAKIDQKDTVRIALEAAVYDSGQCNGISYYRYWARSVRQPSRYRGIDGRTYSLFYIFIVLDGRLYPISQMNETQRIKFLRSHRELIRQKFSTRKTDELESEILIGAARFYD
jgi:hypothetical protein